MSAETKTPLKERLYSLDTLRGFDMFWIIGGEWFIVKLFEYTQWGWLGPVATQMHHTSWAGFRFYDLIFPLFMFISGVAIPYALISKKEKGVPKRNLYRKIFKRMVILVVFGFIYNGMLKNGFTNLRMASVLGQIGIAYFFAALISINTNSVQTRIYWVLGILLGIAGLQLLVPVPGHGAGVLTAEGSINSWIDQHFLPGRLHKTITDPEGWLCIISATSVTLMGSVMGTILRRKSIAPERKAVILLISGVVLIAVALLLSPFYPIIKKLWTVPFDLQTAGISSVLLSLFYFIVDVKKKRGWILFFQVIGLNSITIYMGKRIIDFYHASEFLMGWTVPAFGEGAGELFLIATYIALEWALLYYFFKKKIFLRV